MLFEDDPLQEEEQNDVSLPSKNLVLVLENFDDFKADKEAKLEEWLGGLTTRIIIETQVMPKGL